MKDRQNAHVNILGACLRASMAVWHTSGPDLCDSKTHGPFHEQLQQKPTHKDYWVEGIMVTVKDTKQLMPGPIRLLSAQAAAVGYRMLFSTLWLWHTLSTSARRKQPELTRGLCKLVSKMLRQCIRARILNSDDKHARANTTSRS